jgi:hypothetical protein
MHDFIVDRCADHRRKAVVSKKVGQRSTGGQHIASDSIELQRRDAGNRSGTNRLVHLGHHSPGGAHVPQLASRPSR